MIWINKKHSLTAASLAVFAMLLMGLVLFFAAVPFLGGIVGGTLLTLTTFLLLWSLVCVSLLAGIMVYYFHRPERKMQSSRKQPKIRPGKLKKNSRRSKKAKK